MVALSTWLSCACFVSLVGVGAGAAGAVAVQDSCSVSACDVSDALRDQLDAIREKLSSVVDYENKVQKLELDVRVHLEEARLVDTKWSPRINEKNSEPDNDAAATATAPDWSSDTWRQPRAHDSKAIEDRFLSLEHKLDQLSTKLNDYSEKIDQVEMTLKTMQKWVKTTEDMIRSVNDSAAAATHQMQIKLKDTEKQLRQEIRETVAVTANAPTRHADELNKRNVFQPTSEPSPSPPSHVRPLLLDSCNHRNNDPRVVARHNGQELPNTLIPSGGMVTFECRQPFMEIRGSATVLCWNGTWASSPPTCIIRRRDPNAAASVTTRLQTGAGTTNNVCRPGHAGNVRNPSNCTGFFMCSPGHDPQWVPCATGTFYHTYSDTCEWERPRDCPVT